MIPHFNGSEMTPLHLKMVFRKSGYIFVRNAVFVFLIGYVLIVQFWAEFSRKRNLSMMMKEVVTPKSDFDVDLVYTWVDGNDPLWKAKMLRDSQQNNVRFLGNIFQTRFINYDELKYSIRSVEKHMPWINRIFIVTAGQIPSWLNKSLIINSDNVEKKAEKLYGKYAKKDVSSYKDEKQQKTVQKLPISPEKTISKDRNNESGDINRTILVSKSLSHKIEIEIVDHTDIFPNDAQLPSYNSYAIEFSIVNIKNLSEHFIYMNDDMFIGQDLKKSDFFNEDGIPLIPAFAKVWHAIDTAYKSAILSFSKSDMAGGQYMAVLTNTIYLCQKYFNRTQFGEYDHTPIPLTKSLMKSLGQSFPENIEKTIYSQFRNWNNTLMQQMALLYGYQTKQANLVNINQNHSMFFLANSKDVINNLNQMVRKQAYPKMFCINNDVPYLRSDIHNFFDKFMPFPSYFENI